MFPCGKKYYISELMFHCTEILLQNMYKYQSILQVQDLVYRKFDDLKDPEKKHFEELEIFNSHLI